MRKGIAYVLIGSALTALSGTAAARTHIDVGISFGIPAPVYVAPRAPLYYSEAYGPPPVYVVPAPVYYGPSYYGPPVYRYRGYHHHHRHHHHHHRGHGHR